MVELKALEKIEDIHKNHAINYWKLTISPMVY
jgi:hypothetical protein